MRLWNGKNGVRERKKIELAESLEAKNLILYEIQLVFFLNELESNLCELPLLLYKLVGIVNHEFLIYLGVKEKKSKYFNLMFNEQTN